MLVTPGTGVGDGFLVDTGSIVTRPSLVTNVTVGDSTARERKDVLEELDSVRSGVDEGR